MCVIFFKGGESGKDGEVNSLLMRAPLNEFLLDYEFRKFKKSESTCSK